MEKGDPIYRQYLQILREELRPAMGCTEPIALALAGAKARKVLGKLPEKIQLFVSGNIIKNVKSVVVPKTGGLHGLAAAVCAGIVAGDPDRELQASRIGNHYAFYIFNDVAADRKPNFIRQLSQHLPCLGTGESQGDGFCAAHSGPQLFS